MPPKPKKPPRAARPISKAGALRRAQDHLIKQMFTGARIRRGYFNIDAGMNDYPAWYVYIYPNQTVCGFANRLAHVIIICQETGKILYSGCAQDEG